MSENTGSLPACGQTCFSNLLSIANTQFGCTPGDTACYCSTPQFSSGVKDCAAQACSSSDAQAVSAYLDQFCAGVSITSSVLPEPLSSAFGVPSTAESTSSFQVTAVSSIAEFTPSSALPTPDSISSLATSSSTSTSTSTPTGSSGLSPNAKIGLAAGIPCGVILLLLVGFGAFWFGKRRAKAGMRTSAESSSHPPHGQVWERPEMDGTEVRRQELETQANRAELPGKTYRDEKDVKVVV